ncbi:disulfide bond formation protein B [Algihabitans albus]|uniref:disulfide bond formation protein B n=1 Tax=Algihabitans albus TaxID=2164067 RepID=UPI001F3CD39C|nr:disulfide bond formation protein B [Algihabitans albus]
MTIFRVMSTRSSSFAPQIATRFTPWLAAAVAAAALLGALAFEYIGGYPPCLLCHWQRYAHIAALGLALAALPLTGQARRFATIASALAFLVGAGIAGFHVGVEQGWWTGLPGCSAPDIQGLDVTQLRELLMQAEVVPCDEIAWSLIGISMAGWNLLLSAFTGAAIVWLTAFGERRSEA